MADYPKTFEKAPGHTKVAHTRRDEVRLKWDGYREVPAAESEDVAVPELTEAEMAKLPEAKDAEVVDTTEDDSKPKPSAPKRRN